LWGVVQKDIPIGTSNTREVYGSILADLPEAQMDDIPAVLKTAKILKGEETTLNEMQGLRSKLLETARKARKEGDWNKARICNDVSDAILDDFGIVAGRADTLEAADLQTALAATRKFKERFEGGIVGKILGYEKSGAPAISPELVLDVSIGRSKIKGSVDLDKVIVTPEAVAATERYLGRSFVDAATENGTVPFNPQKAQKWINSNEDILDKFPELRAKMSDAGSAQGCAGNIQAIMEARKKALRNPKVSVAAQFLGAPVDKEVATILKSKNPAGAVRELMRQARKNPDAQEGLRHGFVEHLMESSRSGDFNDIGEKTLSGKAIIANLKANMGAYREVLTSKEISRIHRIAGELSKLEAFEKIGVIDLEKLLTSEDAVSAIMMFGSRFGGAQAGRVAAGKFGGGTVQTPGFFSKAAQKIMGKFIKDHTREMIQDAVLSQDEKLLKALLAPINKPEVNAASRNNLRILNDRLNVWLVGSGKRVMDDIEAEMMEEQNGPTR